MSKRLIVTADDFGRSVEVNAAVEDAHVNGILTSASLMVTEAATADAVARAKRLPRLGVGLHVTLVDGIPALPPAAIPALVGPDGRFGRDLVNKGTRIFLDREAQRQAREEMRAQFERFAATGLRPSHVDFHHHYHQHPTLFAMVLDLAVEFGVLGIRIPWEPPLASIAARGDRIGRRLFNGLAYAPLCGWMRARAKAAGLVVNDRSFGLNDSGEMDLARVASFLDHLPEGLSEIYCHPATGHWGVRPMPSHYQVSAEYRALIDPSNRARVRDRGITLVSFAQAAAEA